jgi:hypothetical protein
VKQTPAVAVSAAALACVLCGQDVTAQGYRTSGQEVVPAYEGWEPNADGSFNLVFGTMNRNWEEELHVPIGSDNNIEPGGPDQGQPTWFLPRRNRFLFRIRVPADFGESELVWTVTSPNGKTYRAYGTLHPDYFIDEAVIQRNSGLGTSDVVLPNVAPELRVEGAATRTARVGVPVTLTAFATDDATDINATQTIAVDNLVAGVDRIIKDGIDVISTTGTYGECYNLLWEEFQTITTAAVDTVRKRVPLFIGVTRATKLPCRLLSLPVIGISQARRLQWRIVLNAMQRPQGKRCQKPSARP